MRIDKISEAEVEILEFLWQENREVPSKEILDYFNDEQGKGLKKQTLNNFLSRLLKKGLIERISQDRRYLYVPTLSKVEFEKCRAEGILNSMYSGSLFKFVSALSGGELITKEEAEEVRKLLKN